MTKQEVADHLRVDPKTVDRYVREGRLQRHQLGGLAVSRFRLDEVNAMLTPVQMPEPGVEATREYSSWKAMKNRCLNPNATGYKDYGGRGIDIDPRWIESFASFLADVGPRPPHKTLDRIDVNKGYWPGNVRWATDLEQARNKRSHARRPTLPDDEDEAEGNPPAA